jgi:mono/diheme cytochrome c family protein
MWRTNLKVIFLGSVVIGFYTFIANIIPQVQSEVPEVLDLSSGFTAEGLAAAGGRLFSGAGGCTACHGLGTRAPNLLTDHAGEGTIGQRCGARNELDCKDYLYQSITEPGVFVVAGFSPIMPDARRQLSLEQIWAMVAFLQSQGGEITVTADDIPDESAAGSEAGAPPQAAAAPPSGFSDATDPEALLTANACLACHMLAGAGGAVGPSFDGIGARLTTAQIRTGIIDPAAGLAEGFEHLAGVMPATFGSQLSAQQLENIVQFLAGQQ